MTSEPLFFSRSEWALLVLSGLWEAIRTIGWPIWDEVTAQRAPNTREEDHLLVIASILARGHGFDMPAPSETDQETHYARVRRALAEIYRVAGAYRELQGIQTPLDVFPSPAHEASTLENTTVDATHIDTLLDLARQGDEATFRGLASCLGVKADRLDGLWTGTVARVRKEPA